MISFTKLRPSRAAPVVPSALVIALDSGRDSLAVAAQSSVLRLRNIVIWTMLGIVLACGAGQSFAQERPLSGKELLGRARNLPLEEVTKSLNIVTPPKSDFQEPPPGAPTIAELKRIAKLIPYNELAREPHNYLGLPIKIYGKVVQALENGNNVILRINVSRGSYGIWTNTAYVNYTRQSKMESRILEGDLVSIWGRFLGIKSYLQLAARQFRYPHVLSCAPRNGGARPRHYSRPRLLWRRRVSLTQCLRDFGAAMNCPVCSSPMVLRTARKGRNAGNQFWGCSRYPACRATRPVSAGVTRTRRYVSFSRRFRRQMRRGFSVFMCSELASLSFALSYLQPHLDRLSPSSRRGRTFHHLLARDRCQLKH